MSTPFQNQFSLSLELTRLVPIGLSVAGKTYEAAIQLARDLQASGSDIIVEEDMAELFGRSRISDNVASSFRTLVTISKEPEHLSGDISLFRGAGPTVARAFSETPYFSTIVQCSFLVFVHERASLAEAISNVFDNQSLAAGQVVRATPNPEAVRGMLRACEDQTAAYNWDNLLQAIAAKLGILEGRRSEDIPISVFKGLITMLPIIQHFPNDHYMIIETRSGLCAIVAWACLVLGLSALVRIHTDQVFVTEARFGSAEEQVLIDYHNYTGTVTHKSRDPSIALLSKSSREELFKFRPEPDENSLVAARKRLARGLAKSTLATAISEPVYSTRVSQELKLIAGGFAICIAKRLRRARNAKPASPLASYEMERYDPKTKKSQSSTVMLQHKPKTFVQISHVISRSRILESACMLFDDESISIGAMEEYAELYKGMKLRNIEKPPSSLLPVFKEWACDCDDQSKPFVIRGFWEALQSVALDLGILILAFAHVTDLDIAGDLILTGTANLIHRSELYRSVKTWDGQTALEISANSWFQILALLMVGAADSNDEMNDVGLFSNNGWSLFVNTFGDPDPAYIEPGWVAVKSGVPWRNGVWKHKIRDGPQRDNDKFVPIGLVGDCITSGKIVKMGCPLPSDFGVPLIGDKYDGLVISLRIETEAPSFSKTLIRRTGYYSLWKTLWNTERTKSCPHIAQIGEEIELEPGWLACNRFGGSYDAENWPVVINLTTENKAARWDALITINGQAHDRDGTLVRVDDCCFKCAVEQASSREGGWFLIL